MNNLAIFYSKSESEDSIKYKYLLEGLIEFL